MNVGQIAAPEETSKITPTKTAYSRKKSVHLSKADLIVTNSDDIIARPDVRYKSCKININQIIQYYC